MLPLSMLVVGDLPEHRRQRMTGVSVDRSRLGTRDMPLISITRRENQEYPLEGNYKA
jgi:hypothetical protein